VNTGVPPGKWHDVARLLEGEAKRCTDPADIFALHRAALYMRRRGDEEAQQIKQWRWWRFWQRGN